MYLIGMQQRVGEKLYSLEVACWARTSSIEGAMKVGLYGSGGVGPCVRLINVDRSCDIDIGTPPILGSDMLSRPPTTRGRLR